MNPPTVHPFVAAGSIEPIIISVATIDSIRPNPCGAMVTFIDASHGIIVRGGNIDNVEVGGAVGDVLVPSGNVIRVTANFDSVTPAGRFDGIVGTIYGVDILLVEVGDGLRLHYHERGTGQPVVFLHGSATGASGWSNFKHNLPYFAERGLRALSPVR